ncbi:hypothetical protein PF005_g5391 [Phytophthora fragariae]|uniref:RxLR effector protein n=2 Tax=Phytophthora TaxID=4783 RepID=A0A6A3SZD7_9STRA|nr:hypothetical protein PF003_g3655 [Phytophthora fragariae]KAE9043322.1 hypothetical protein PR002_g3413 [Phytophthora rubi]KAE8944082.1 hypothetical protein PF009_g6221 [Phytophthora fragariae]KAE9021909.1 hypothetical protein PF011_g4719 [Phytophthora fragariae]KAE9049387.1 hypothetical protein PR001_g3359 [Phytophthora rubi]
MATFVLNLSTIRFVYARAIGLGRFNQSCSETSTRTHNTCTGEENKTEIVSCYSITRNPRKQCNRVPYDNQ